MHLDMLNKAVEQARATRGVVMLSVPGNSRWWCSVHAAVDGRLEVHVAEPARGWRRWQRPPGERWLADNGFIRTVDAWAASAPRHASRSWCATTMSTALAHGLGAPDESTLEVQVAFRGTVGEEIPPEPKAPHAEHIGHAMRSLAAQRRGNASLAGGTPSETWAWVFGVPEGLRVSPETPGDPGDYGEDWTVGTDAAAVDEAVVKLTNVLYTAHGRDPAAPLFVEFRDPDR